MFKNVLLLFPLLIISCTDIKSTRYKDTSQLEQPPTLVIVQRPKIKEVKKEDIKKTGIGKNVSFVDSAENPVIKIKKLFDRSWVLVGQALYLSKIEIKDKNREQGVFYVLYDPDVEKSDDTDLLDLMTFFLFKDDFEEATYKLTVAWRETNTEVSVELVDEDSNSDLLDDQEDKKDFDGSVDSGKKLLLNVYKTIRDDVPLN